MNVSQEIDQCPHDNPLNRKHCTNKQESLYLPKHIVGYRGSQCSRSKVGDVPSV